MSWAAFLEHVQGHPENFVGPIIADVVVQALETGILINQSVRFWSRAEHEPRVTRLLVAFVSCAAAFQTLIVIYNTWRVLVIGYGNTALVVDVRWADRIQPALNCVMAAPFQAFLIWRCWNVLQRRWIILAPLAALLLATVIMNVYITFDIFYAPSAPNDLLTAVLYGPPRSYITAFVLTAVLDMLITSLMMWFLLRVKSHVVSRRFAKTLARLHRMVWEAAVPPCACAIAACVVYITMSSENLWDLFLQSIVGKLYAISLFVILNGRADLKWSLPFETRSSHMLRYWANGGTVQFRVDLTSVIDRQAQLDVDLTPTANVAHSRAEVQGDKSNTSICEHCMRLNSDRGRGGLPISSQSPLRETFFETLDATETSGSSVTRPPPTVLRRSGGRGDQSPSF